MKETKEARKKVDAATTRIVKKKAERGAARAEKRTQSRGTEENKEDALHYMQTLVAVARESFLILDPDLKVISANPIFYNTFSVKEGETEQKLLFELGNGQWNIDALRSLLKKVLPEKKDVKDFEVTHTFESIGEKTMLLNASQIDSIQLIVIAIEDISERKRLENKLAAYTKELEITVSQKTADLTERVKELELLNKAMVGRELKMVELKKELEELKK